MSSPPVLAVHTSARPSGASYLERTLRSLEEAGALDWPGPRIVFHDGGTIEPRPGWQHCGTGGANGNRRASWTLFHLVGDADLVVLEDDVIACRKAVSAALKLQVPDNCAMVSMFDRWLTGPYGLHLQAFEGPTFKHAQALKLPARTVRWLRERGVPHHADEARLNSRDWALGYRLHFSPWPRYGVVMPNWFEHVGDVSSMVHNRRAAPLRSASWTSDHNALTWPPVIHARPAFEVPEGLEQLVRLRPL